jgi:N,N'-diacetyllegionaminate synthase
MGSSSTAFTIGSTPVDAGSVYVIAEAGVNHNGDLERAKEMIDAAAESGADAVKFQTFTADRLVADSAPTATYQDDTTDAESQSELLERYELGRNAHIRLQRYCDGRDITFLSTPFDAESADLLHELDVPAIKLGSGELTNHPLLRHVAEFGRPMIVSTGMGRIDEIRAALAEIRDVDPDADVALLHCTTAYPADVAEVNLRAMERMAEEFDVPVGYSDHTTLVEMPAFATAAGALIVEKHLTLDRSLPGPDHHASLEPDEFDRAVTLARQAALARGNPEKRPTESERERMSFPYGKASTPHGR